VQSAKHDNRCAGVCVSVCAGVCNIVCDRQKKDSLARACGRVNGGKGVRYIAATRQQFMCNIVAR